jgi:hypothetical protein
LVVTSKPSEGDVAPTTLKKSTEEDDTEKIEEMITDKPKKSKANANSNHKKPDTTRDVTANNSDTNSNSSTTSSNSNKKEPGAANNSVDKPIKNTSTPANRTSNPIKPGGGESRPKPQPKP